MKVATRLALGFGALIALLVGLLLYQLSMLHGAVQTNRELTATIARLTLTSTDQMGRLDRMEENASKYLVTLEPGYERRHADAVEAFDRTVSDLLTLPLTGAERVEVDRLAALWEDHLQRGPSLEERAVHTSRLIDLSRPLAELAAEADVLRGQTRRVAEASREAITATVRQSAQAAWRAERISWVAAVAALLMGLLVSWRIVRSISDSLGRLKEGTRRVADGDFSYRLDSSRDDEFAQLARDFNVMTRRLGELDRAKRDFLSQVSHDLKTPLASMQETNQLLLEELVGPLEEKQRELLRLNLRSARRLSAMIAKLLDLARMDAGVLEYDFGRHDLVPLVRLVVDEYGPRGRERGVDVTAVLPARPLHAECDADRMVQLAANLVENAVKFSPRGGEVRVSLSDVDLSSAGPDPSGNGGRVSPEDGTQTGLAPESESSHAVILSVADRGPGVSAGDKERIFERFHQGRNGRGAADRGVGLGLALCREVAAAHGGWVWVEDRPGGGSVFLARLPRHRSTTPRPPAAVAGSGSGR